MKQIGLAVAFAIWSATGAQAQDADIRAVITQQFEAFKADDFATAFSYASPSLQGYFQTPQNFGQMVTQGYPMVWRPAAVDYLELREDGGTYWQKVQIADQSGKFHYLEYRMMQTPEGWRISGVKILDAPGATV
jgi:hypothetical protein